MHPHPQLQSLYEEWRRLSEAEGNAIQSAAWGKVLLFQTQKSDLQRQIMEVMQSEDPGRGRNTSTGADLVEPFRPVISQLIELENRNSRWLADARTGMEKERNAMECHQRNLKQLRQAYGSTGADARWNSYS